MKGSGIYKIQSIIHPERCYIGSTMNFKNRWKKHLHDLKFNKHSPKIQNHFNKYGESDLVFIIIEPCLPEFLIIREQYYLDLYNPWFNILKIAGSNLGMEVSKKTKDKLSKSHKGLNTWSKGQIAWNKGIPNKSEKCNLCGGFISKQKKHICIKFSELTLKKRSESPMGENNSFYNKKHSEESKKMNSDSCKKIWKLRKLNKSA